MSLDAADLVRLARTSTPLNKTDFARAAGTSRAAIADFERGHRIPRFDTLQRALEVAGQRMQVICDTLTSADPETTPETTGLLADWVANLDVADSAWTWRSLISDFVANRFVPATAVERASMLTVRPAPTADRRWDSFVRALAEHLAWHADLELPTWVFEATDPDGPFWWPVHGELPSMRSAALAHSPASFKRRRILVDGREIPTVRA